MGDFPAQRITHVDVILALVAFRRDNRLRCTVCPEEHHAVAVFSPGFAAGDHSCKQLCFLLIDSGLYHAAFIPVNGKARRPASDQHAGVQNNLVRRVI